MVELTEFPGYFITKDGKVFSAWKNQLLGRGKSKTYIDYDNLKELKPFIVSGYHTVCLCKNKKKHTKLIHRLVAITYISNPNNLLEVNHIDENKLNNHITNLEWMSNQQNIEHSRCRYTWTVENIDTGDLTEFNNFSEFCRENKLSYSGVYETFKIRGKRKKLREHYRNYKIISRIKRK